MRFAICLALVAVAGCDNSSSRSAHEAPIPSYPTIHDSLSNSTPLPTLRAHHATVVHTTGAGTQAEDHTCPRPGYFGVPMRCCPSGTCNVATTTGSILSLGYEAELGPTATVHYVVRSIDFNREAPFRSVVIEGSYTHVRITRDTSTRYRHQLVFNIRPIGGVQRYTHVFDYAYTLSCAELHANHMRNRPEGVPDDPWICVDLTPRTKIRRLTEQETREGWVNNSTSVPMDAVATTSR